MAFRFLIFLFFLSIVFNITASAQIPEENKTNIDTLKENIIYEYDTIYLAPDTVRITDTIYHLLPLQIKKHHFSIEAVFVPYFYSSFNSQFFSDTLLVKNNLNYNFTLNLVYEKNRYLFSAGIGFSPFHEHLSKTTSTLSSTSATNGQQLYDSLLIINDCTTENYYNYLGLQLMIGRKWTYRKLNFELKTYLITNLLLNYKAYYPTSEPENEIRKSDVLQSVYSVCVSSGFGYQFTKRIGLNISPFYSYSFSNRHKFPRRAFQSIGIGVGVKFLL